MHGIVYAALAVVSHRVCALVLELVAGHTTGGQPSSRVQGCWPSRKSGTTRLLVRIVGSERCSGESRFEDHNNNNCRACIGAGYARLFERVQNTPHLDTHVWDDCIKHDTDWILKASHVSRNAISNYTH